MNDIVKVVTSGSINRADRCPACGNGMFFRVEGTKEIGMFCGQFDCRRWLMEVPAPREKERE